MLKNTAPLTDVSLQSDTHAPPNGLQSPLAEDRAAGIWVSRVTSIVGLICLALALFEWAVRPGHSRTVLALLTIAMFAAILRSYSFDNGA